MKEFTGIVNIQHRDAKIIEVSLRLARGGAYLLSTENPALITNVNNIFLKKEWNHHVEKDMQFKPFYVYKCFTTLPIVYVWPQKIIDGFMEKRSAKPFYEYYFEPVGKSGMVFFQFMDDNFERGMQTKKEMEELFNKSQIVAYVLIALAILLLLSQWSYRYFFFFIVLLLFLTRLFNPIMVNYKLYKAQKQAIFKSGPTKDTETDVEPFDAKPF
jgi:hypothetical protein